MILKLVVNFKIAVVLFPFLAFIYSQHVSFNSSNPFNLTTDHNHTLGSCLDSWPQLEIIVPINLKSLDKSRALEWHEIFLKSFLLFWPLKISKTSLQFAVDSEYLNSSEYFDFYERLKTIRHLVHGGVHISNSYYSPDICEFIFLISISIFYLFIYLFICLFIIYLFF